MGCGLNFDMGKLSLDTLAKLTDGFTTLLFKKQLTFTFSPYGMKILPFSVNSWIDPFEIRSQMDGYWQENSRLYLMMLITLPFSTFLMTFAKNHLLVSFAKFVPPVQAPRIVIFTTHTSRPMSLFFFFDLFLDNWKKDSCPCKWSDFFSTLMFSQC